MATPAIFLDRDGVLNENYPTHVKSWSEFRFLPHTLNALRVLARVNVPIIVITNQAIINRGSISANQVDEIHRRMVARIRAARGRVDRVYLCPHRQDERCNCRKPAPGMLLRAAEELDIDLTRSVLVGDAITDVIAGQRAGCGTILVQTGRGLNACDELYSGAAGFPDAIVGDLYQAIPSIVEVLDRRSNSRHPVLVVGDQLELLDNGLLDQ